MNFILANSAYLIVYRYDATTGPPSSSSVKINEWPLTKMFIKNIGRKFD